MNPPKWTQRRNNHATSESSRSETPEGGPEVLLDEDSRIQGYRPILGKRVRFEVVEDEHPKRRKTAEPEAERAQTTKPEAVPLRTAEIITETGETEDTFNREVGGMSRAAGDSRLAQGERALEGRQSDDIKDGVDTDDVRYPPLDAARRVEQQTHPIGRS